MTGKHPLFARAAQARRQLSASRAVPAAAQDESITIDGIFTRPYGDIVQPDRVWAISKYFLRRWTPYLGPSAVWLIIGARQLSYRNRNRPWFAAYDTMLADAAGIHVDVYRRTLKKEIVAGEGAVAYFLEKKADPAYVVRDDVPRKGRTRYTIRRDDPLTPGDAAHLAGWLRAHAPETVNPAAVATLLHDAQALPARSLQAPAPDPVAIPPTRQLSVVDVVADLFPGVAASDAWHEAADALHNHITGSGTVHLEPHYLREQWLPRLGPGPTLLLVYLRSFAYCNEKTGEKRDKVALSHDELAAVLQTSKRTLRRWFARIDQETPGDTAFGPFVTALNAEKQPDQSVLTVYRVNLNLPLTAPDLQAYRERVAALTADVPDKKSATEADAPRKQADKKSVTHDRDDEAETGGVADKKSATERAPAGETDKASVTIPGRGQKDGNREGGGGQKRGRSQPESRPYKYYNLLFHSLEDASGGESFTKTSQQQHLWYPEPQAPTDAFAVVVANGSPAKLLKHLQVQEPARSQILEQGASLAELVAWYLYAEAAPELHNPLGYWITRASAGDPAPDSFVRLAKLSWEQWRSYAAACALQASGVTRAQRWAELPGFVLWEQVYGATPPAALPFGVGAGLDAFCRCCVPADPAPEDVAAPGPAPEAGLAAAQAVWEEALSELRLIMLQSTFDANLRGSQVAAYEDGAWTIAVASEAAAAWLGNSYRRQVMPLLALLAAEAGDLAVARVRFVGDPGAASHSHF